MDHSSSIATCIASEDFAALEPLARDLRRHDDTVAVQHLGTQLLAEVLRRWRARPLPRLGELATVLGRHCGGPATARLAADTRKKLPDEVFEAMLADADRLVDLDALLEAATRGTSDAIHFRVATLRTWLAGTPDPRVTSALLRWLEAPPIRAVSSQPMWKDVFEILFTQGDPRTLDRYAVLREAEFPAGSTMQRWIAERLDEELDRWRARRDHDALAALVAPGAEADQADTLDTLAQLVATLTGEEPVARGGRTIVASVTALLPAVPAATDAPWADARGSLASTLALAGRDWDSISAADDGARLAVSDDAQVVAVDAERKLLWQLQPHLEPDCVVTGYAMSPSGRWLAVLENGRRLVVVDLDAGHSRHVELALPAPAHEDEGAKVFERDGLAWSHDERKLLTVHVVSDATTTVHYLVETQFDPDPSHIAAQRLVHRHGELDDDGVGRRTRVDGRSAHAHYASFPAHLSLSPSGRRLLAIYSPAAGYDDNVVTVFERDAHERWRVHRQLAMTARIVWIDDTHLAAQGVRFSSRAPRSPPGVLEIDTGWFTPDDRALQALEAHAYLLDRASVVPVARVAHLATAARADLLAVVPSSSDGDVEVYDLTSGALVARARLDSTIRALALASDGRLVAYASKSSTLVMEMSAEPPGKPVRLKGHKDSIEQVLVTDDAAPRIVSLAADGVMVWSTHGERLLDLRHRTGPTGMALHPASRALAVSEADRITLWDLHSGHEVASVELDGEPRSLCWTPDATALTWASGHRLMRWRPTDDRNAPAVVLEHDSPLLALASHVATDTFVAADASGRVLLVDEDADEVRLRCIATGFVHPDHVAVSRDGRACVGGVRLGAHGSVTLLAPSTTPSRPVLTPGSRPFDMAGDGAGALAFGPSCGTIERAQRDIAARAPVTSVAPDEVVKLRKALRHVTRRAGAVPRFIARADPALWEITLAELDPGKGGKDPVLGLFSSARSGWLVALLTGAPDGLEIVDAWRRALTHISVPDTPPLDALRSSYVTSLSMTPRVVGRDLRGLPALDEIRLGDLEAGDTAEDIERLLAELIVDEGKRLALQLAPRALRRTPRLTDTPFDRLTLDSSATITALTGLEPLRSLEMLHQLGVEDLGDLAGCTRLERLVLNGCSVESLCGLEHTPLQHLVVGNDQHLTDLAPVAGLTTLHTLEIRRAPLSDLASLGGGSALRTLSLVDLALTTLDGLAATSLEHVTLQLGELTDAAALAASAHTLHTLSLRGCAKLTSLEGLDDATSLRTLDLRGCASLATLPPLDDCTQLDHVWLRGTPLTPDDVSPHVRARASWAAIPLPG